MTETRSSNTALHRGILPAGWIVAIAATLVLMAVALWFGDLNQDEGWYLYAAREVTQGRLPFLHFATTQGPVMPFVYALGNPLVDRFGVAGGRLFTALLGLAASVGAAFLARSLVPAERRGEAALLAFSLVGVNVYQCYFSTIVKTYALTGLLLVIAFAVLAAARRGRAQLALVSGALMALAAGTRSSAGFAAVATFLGLAWDARQARRPGTSRAPSGVAPSSTLWLWFTVGAGVAGTLVFVPFAWLSPVGTWFALFEYHAGREIGGVMIQLAYKAGFVSRVVSAYLVAGGLLACGLLWRVFRVAERPPENHDGLLARLVWSSVALVTLVHLAAPFPYDDYQTFVFPLVAAALSAGLLGHVTARRQVSWLVMSVLALNLLAAGASPMTWQWFLGERDRIWWPLKEQSPLSRLREAGAFLRTRTEPGELLLTQDTYLAVEAGLRVPPGLELGPFSYFPDWSPERAEARHVLGKGMLEAQLAGSGARVAAFSGYGLSIRCPEVAPIAEGEQERLRQVLERGYTPVRTWQAFGQAATELTVYERRTSDL